MEIKIANESDSEKWDKIVENSPHGTIFHTWKWLKIMEKHSSMKIMRRPCKSKLYPLMGLKGTTLIGICPLFFYKNLLFNSVHSPPIGTGVTYLGPVLSNYDKLKQNKRESIFTEFQKQVDKFIFSELKLDSIRIKTPPGLNDSRPFKWTGYQIEPLYNYSIDLSKGIDYVWQQFPKSIRKNIKHTKKSISVEEDANLSNIKYVWNSLFERYREQDIDLDILTPEYLFDLYKTYPENLKIFVARYQNEIVSGAIKICYKDKVISWMGHIKTELKGIYPNDLIHWEAMRWAYEHGFKYYEIIWANNKRLCRYKSKYNPDLSLYFLITKNSARYKFMKSAHDILTL